MKRIVSAVLFSVLFSSLVSGSVSVNVNGSSYTIPQTNERGWGTSVTTWMQAISANTLQPIGGSFTLSNDVDFGASSGLKSKYFLTRSSNPASTGLLRLSNTDSISWRNFANSGDLGLSVNSSDQLLFNGSQVLSGLLTNSNIAAGAGIAYSKLALSNSILNADINSAAGISYSKLSLSNSILNADINSSAAIAFSKLAPLTSAQILVGNVSNVATAVGVTGDISLSNAGVTAYSGTVPLAKGGTGQTTKGPAFDALSPMSALGDIIYGGASGTGTRLAAGSNGQFLTLAAGIPSWGNIGDLGVASKSSAYTATTADQVITLNAAGGAFTLTLYNPVGNTGKTLRLIKTDSSANYVTLGTYNVNGASRKLCTPYEELTIVSDGTNWLTLSHTTFATGTYTPTLSNFSVGGTGATNAGRWVRRGGNILISLATNLGSTGSGTAGTVTWSMPTGYTIEQARLADTTAFSTIRNRIGSAYFYDNSAAAGVGVEVGAFDTNNLSLFKSTNTSAVTATDVGASDQFGFLVEVPVTDWW